MILFLAKCYLSGLVVDIKIITYKLSSVYFCSHLVICMLLEINSGILVLLIVVLTEGFGWWLWILCVKRLAQLGLTCSLLVFFLFGGWGLSF